MRKPAFLPKLKKPPAKKQTGNTALDFAIGYDMLVEDEIKACQLGDMDVTGSHLMNLNHPHATLKTGERLKLYQGRGTRIKALRLIGREV
jgi:hypothetical protein